MSDDGDRHEHAGTDAETTPFDHGCPCPTCTDYRTEVRKALTEQSTGGLSESQFQDARRLYREMHGDQTALSGF